MDNKKPIQLKRKSVNTDALQKRKDLSKKERMAQNIDEEDNKDLSNKKSNSTEH